MAELPSVPAQQVVAILCREPLGEALWRAATNEAVAEMLAQRLGELEQKQEG